MDFSKDHTEIGILNTSLQHDIPDHCSDLLLQKIKTENIDLYENEIIKSEYSEQSSNLLGIRDTIEADCRINIKNDVNVKDEVIEIQLKKEQISDLEIEIDGHAECDIKQLQRKSKHRLKYQCPFCTKCYSSWTKRAKCGCGRYSEKCFYCGQFFFHKLQFLTHFIVNHYLKHKIGIGKRRNCKYTKKRIDAKQLQFKICSIFFEKRQNFNVGNKNTKINLFKYENLRRQRRFFIHYEFSSTLNRVVFLYSCKICSKSFTTKSQLEAHIKSHTGEKPFRCNFCTKMFTRNYYFQVHMRIHTNEKPIKCEICHKVFSCNSNLKSHMKCHTGVGVMKCDICSKICITNNHLVSHMRTHTGEKPFNCEICSKSFAVTGSLNRHMRIHTGEKPYSCTICLKAFNESSVLKRHMRVHSGEKPFACEVCSKTYTHKDKLKLHMRNHTGEKPYTCTVCSKTFTQSEHLKQHTRIHTGEKPFKCEICLKTFYSTGNLIQHLRIHTSERPFICNVCSKTFKVKRSLRQHMKTHPTVLIE